MSSSGRSRSVRVMGATTVIGILLLASGTLPMAATGATASASEPASSPARSANPCAYVTAAQAASILHVRAVVQSEAPLGPTCIFRVKNQKTEVTLAVEALNLKAELHTMKAVSRSGIAVGRVGYCGRRGSPMLLVPLRGNLVLVVNAPCGEARAFATIALRRLKAVTAG